MTDAKAFPTGDGVNWTIRLRDHAGHFTRTSTHLLDFYPTRGAAERAAGRYGYHIVDPL